MAGNAVKSTLVPAQTGFFELEITWLTGRTGLTVIFRVLDVAGFPVVQVAFDVRTQVTASLFEGT